MRVQDAYSEAREHLEFSLDGTSFPRQHLWYWLCHLSRRPQNQIDETRHHSTNEMKFYTADLGKTEEEIAQGDEILHLLS